MDSRNEVVFSIDSAPFVNAITYTPQTFDEIFDTIIGIYEDVSEKEIRQDLADFLNELVAIGLVEDIENSFLKDIQINLTERCNERCIHCYIPHERRRHGKTLSIENCKLILDDFVALGGKNLSLSGGEALLHSDISSILRYARFKGLRVSLLSNLTLLDDSLLDILLECEINEVQVSLYSVIPEEHDAITRMKGSCERTMSAIKQLRSHNIDVKISCPVMKTNLQHFMLVLDFAESVGAASQCNCNLTMDMDFGRKNEDNLLSIEETRWFCYTLLRYHNEKGHKDFTLGERCLRSDQIKYHKWFVEQSPCGSEIDKLSINGNGDVCPCPSWEISLGNIHNERLVSIWNNSEKLKEIRKIKNKDLGACSDCEYIDYCVACPATKYNDSAGYLDKTSKYMCQMAQIAYNVEQEFKKKSC